MRFLLSCWPWLVLLLAPACSAERRYVTPPDFPKTSSYTPAVLVDGTLYVSGQIGQDWKTGRIPEEFEAEMRQCLKNLQLVLAEAHMSMGDVVTVQVHLRDINLLDRMNDVFARTFRDPRPARTTIAVAGLPGNARVGITAVAQSDRSRFLPMRTHP